MGMTIIVQAGSDDVSCYHISLRICGLSLHVVVFIPKRRELTDRVGVRVMCWVSQLKPLLTSSFRECPRRPRNERETIVDTIDVEKLMPPSMHTHA